MRPSITRRELEERADTLIDTLATCGANLGVHSGAEAVDSALEPLEARGILVVNRGRVRVRNRNVLRYYARSLDHLLNQPSLTHSHRPPPPSPRGAAGPSPADVPPAVAKHDPQASGVVVRHGHAEKLCPALHR